MTFRRCALECACVSLCVLASFTCLFWLKLKSDNVRPRLLYLGVQCLGTNPPRTTRVLEEDQRPYKIAAKTCPINELEPINRSPVDGPSFEGLDQPLVVGY